jgi:hypothetical protein
MLRLAESSQTLCLECCSYLTKDQKSHNQRVNADCANCRATGYPWSLWRLPIEAFALKLNTAFRANCGTLKGRMGVNPAVIVNSFN